jgi:hypothetical protein
MAEGLESLCSKISLTDGEKTGIRVVEGDVAETRERSMNCLVGKVWTGKSINKEAFTTVLSRIWRTVGQVIFKELQDNCWLFKFSGEDDKKRVLEGRPWSYDRCALVLIEFEGKLLLCMSKGVGIKIGESLGALEDVDVAGDGAGWGRCLRLRVVINLSKPLERGRALEFGGRSHWVSLKYEKLPLCCFYCGRVVHGSKGCPVRKPQCLNAEEGEKQWGSWIRADIPRSNRLEKSSMGGGSSPSTAGSASDGNWRSFQPLSHANADGGESATSTAERGLTRGGERVMGVGAECGVESCDPRGVDQGGDRGEVGTAVGGHERDGMLQRAMTPMWEAQMGENSHLETTTEDAEIGGVQRQQKPPRLSSSFGNFPSTNTMTCTAVTHAVERTSEDVHGHVEVNGNVACSPALAPVFPEPLDRVMLDATALSTDSACRGLGLELERRSVIPVSASLADPVAGGSNLRRWKRQARNYTVHAEVQTLVGGLKQKSNAGLQERCKGKRAVGKKGKKNHVLSLNDTEELAEADVQLRQQP